MLLEPLNLLWIVRATGGDVFANLLTSYRATRSLIEALAESLPQTIFQTYLWIRIQQSCTAGDEPPAVGSPPGAPPPPPSLPAAVDASAPPALPPAPPPPPGASAAWCAHVSVDGTVLVISLTLSAINTAKVLLTLWLAARAANVSLVAQIKQQLLLGGGSRTL